MAKTTSKGQTQWPQSRPCLWHALARIDRVARFSRFYGEIQDVVLLYHSVGGIPGSEYAWDLAREQFRDQIRSLSRRYRFTDLEALLTDGGEEKRVAVTFDDALRNFYDVAAPILRGFDVPATVFVCSDFVGDANVEKLRRRHDLPLGAHDITMTADQLREVAEDDLFTLGNHTSSHPNLAEVTDSDTLRAEIVGAKHDLEDRLGVEVDRFSYPYGFSDEKTRRIVEETHDIAVTSEPSLVRPETDPHQIPRLDACLPLSTLQFEATDLANDARHLVR